MARIELRDCTIKIKDGFGGTAAVADSSIMAGNTTLEIDSVANLTNNTDIVPVGARFSITGVATPDEFTVTAQNANQQWELEIVDATGGDFDLTVDGQAVDNIAFDANAAAIQSAINTIIGASSVTVTGTNPFVIEGTGGDYDAVAFTITGDFAGLTGAGGEDGTLTELHEGAITWQLTFTPALDGGDLPMDTDVITFAPQEVEITVGDGDVTYSEKNEYLYDLDRGSLDTVREGDDQPLEVTLDFVYEHITTGTSEDISPMDALKRKGGASGWVSSAADQCEPYAVDIEIYHTVPCGTNQDEVTVFPDFRSDQRDVSFNDAVISVTGRCNAVEPIVTRI
jgi:hypothetical protein